MKIEADMRINFNLEVKYVVGVEEAPHPHSHPTPVLYSYYTHTYLLEVQILNMNVNKEIPSQRKKRNKVCIPLPFLHKYYSTIMQ